MLGVSSRFPWIPFCFGTRDLNEHVIISHFCLLFSSTKTIDISCLCWTLSRLGLCFKLKNYFRDGWLLFMSSKDQKADYCYAHCPPISTALVQCNWIVWGLGRLFNYKQLCFKNCSLLQITSSPGHLKSFNSGLTTKLTWFGIYVIILIYSCQPTDEHSWQPIKTKATVMENISQSLWFRPFANENICFTGPVWQV